MAVEHAPSVVDEPRDRAQHDRPDRDLVDEVAITDVEVEDACAGVEQALELLAEASEVRGVDRRLDDARRSPLSPKSPAYSTPVGHDDEKRLAAEAAAELVEAGMAVGLGTGTTVTQLLPALAARRLDIRCVATSLETEQAARELGLRGGAVRVARSARPGDRRRRPGVARRLAREGRRCGADTREDRRRGS